MGWIPDAKPDFDAGSPVVMMHDTLEHLTAPTGTIQDELIAFGSIFYMRVEAEILHHERIPGEYMIIDGAGFSNSTYLEHKELIPEPPQSAALSPLLEFYLEYYVDCMKSCAAELWDDMVVHGLAAKDLAPPDFEAQARRAIGWIRAGYHKAAEFWNIENPYERRDFCYRLEKRLERWFNPNDPTWLGKHLHIEVDTDGPTYSIVERVPRVRRHTEQAT